MLYHTWDSDGDGYEEIRKFPDEAKANEFAANHAGAVVVTIGYEIDQTDDMIAERYARSLILTQCWVVLHFPRTQSKSIDPVRRNYSIYSTRYFRLRIIMRLFRSSYPIELGLASCPTDFFDRNTGASGELSHEKKLNTSVYNGLQRGGFEVVSEERLRINTANQKLQQ